jgi:hypothetical protein
MAWTIQDRNSRPCLQAILSFFCFPTEKIANKICGCCCTGASIPFLSEIHVDRLYNQTLNALFSISQPRLNSALCPVHWSVHCVHPFIFVFCFLCLVLTLKPLLTSYLSSFLFFLGYGSQIHEVIMVPCWSHSWLAQDQQQNFHSVGFKWLLWFMFSVFNQSICHFDFHNSMVGYKTINKLNLFYDFIIL